MAEFTERQQFYKTHLDAAAAEGTTIAQYARQHDVPAYGLYDIRRRIRAGSGFVRVVTPAPSAQTQLEIRLPNGLAVSVVSGDVTSVLRAVASL